MFRCQVSGEPGSEPRVCRGHCGAGPRSPSRNQKSVPTAARRDASQWRPPQELGSTRESCLASGSRTCVCRGPKARLPPLRYRQLRGLSEPLTPGRNLGFCPLCFSHHPALESTSLSTSGLQIPESVSQGANL